MNIFTKRELYAAFIEEATPLFADSIDFLEDATVNGLILIALGWSAWRRSIVGMILAAVLFAPGIATAWAAWEKFNYLSLLLHCR